MPATSSSTADPDSVPETLCMGRFNVTVNGALATMTFTHARPKVGPLFDAGNVELESIVRARLVTSIENLAALKDLLTAILQSQAGTGQTSSTKLN